VGKRKGGRGGSECIFFVGSWGVMKKFCGRKRKKRITHNGSVGKKERGRSGVGGAESFSSIVVEGL